MSIVIDIQDILNRYPRVKELHEKMIREYDDYYEAELEEAVSHAIMQLLAPRLSDIVRDTAEMVKESMEEMLEG
jgi:hypothetical protein